MEAKMPACVKAGRVFRLLGWLQLVAGVLLVVALAAPQLAKGGVSARVFVAMSLPLAFFIGLGVAHLLVGSALKQHKGWARIAGIVYGALALIGIPIGTIIGAFLLLWLVKQWDDGTQTPSTTDMET